MAKRANELIDARQRREQHANDGTSDI